MFTRPPLTTPRSAHRCGVMLLGAITCLLVPALGSEEVDALRKVAQTEVEEAQTQRIFKKAELAIKYATALDGLEKTLTTQGNLDAVVHLREERDSIRKNGAPTAHNDKELTALRAKYLKGLTAIDADLKASRAKTVEGVARKLREQETALTRAGKVDEALALRKEVTRMLLEFSGGAAADAIPFTEDPRMSARPDLKPLDTIQLPAEKPPVAETPFSIKGRWLESMTIPTSKQRIRDLIMIGDRAPKKWPLVVVAPGSIWSGSDRGAIELSACKFVAEKCRFETLQLGSDHACHYFFKDSTFDRCTFPRVGVWSGGKFAAKFFFTGCHIQGSFSNEVSIWNYGLRIDSSVIEDVKLPPMIFGDDQPADFVNDSWMRVNRCRFIKCTVPLSFLLLTRDCIFEDCTFVPDAKSKDAAITKPIEVVIYENNCKSKLPEVLPGKITLTRKSAASYQGDPVPTASSLAASF